MANEGFDELKSFIESAFPNGDLTGHYEYHKKVMKQEEDRLIAAAAKAAEDKRVAEERADERKAIVLEVKKKVIAGTVWAIVLVGLTIIADKLFGIHLS
jgi:hypothetical protein